MKTFFKSLLWPFIALAIYFSVQTVCIIPLVIINMIAYRNDPEALMNPETLMSGTGVGLVLLVSSIITGIIIVWLKPFGLRNAFKGLGCSRWSAVIAFVGVLVGLFASNLINEYLDLPNMFEDMFNQMAGSVWGMLSIGVFGPIAEEIVFRGGIMKPMLARGVRPWTAIIISALVFGLIHGNPVQIPFAALVGVMFGVIYYKTKSLVITSICHIVNNSFSVILMNIYGSELDDMTMRATFGEQGTKITLGLAILVCALLLTVFWKRTSSKTWQEAEGELPPPPPAIADVEA